MQSRFMRVLLVVAAAVALHAGPVAACVCADAPAPAMPCCPDEPQGAGHGDHGLPATDGYSACDASAAELLVGSGSPELSLPIGIAGTAPPVWAHGAPVIEPPPPAAYESPPIYLVTLRLRN